MVMFVLLLLSCTVGGMALVVIPVLMMFSLVVICALVVLSLLSIVMLSEFMVLVLLLCGV